DSFNTFRVARGLVAIHQHGAQAHVPDGRFKADWHVVQEPSDDQFFFYSDHAVVRPRHADIRDVSRTLGKHALIGGGNVSVSADQSSDAAVQVPAEGYFFRGRLGMNINEDYFGLDLGEQFVGHAKRIVVRSHEDPALQIDDCIRHSVFLALVKSPAGQSRSIVCRA